LLFQDSSFNQDVTDKALFSADTIPKQQSIISRLRTLLTFDPTYFKRVYKHTFLIARTPGQKSLPLDIAIEYWRLLLQPPSILWISLSTPWLE